MTTDWNLTTLLAALGGVVLVGLLAQGWWSARKAGPRRAEPLAPVGDRQEPSLGAGGAAPGQARVVPALHGGEPPGLGPVETGHEQPDRLLGGAADRESPELRRRREPGVLEHGPPRVAVMRARVDEHAVHVEDDRAGRAPGHRRR